MESWWWISLRVCVSVVLYVCVVVVMMLAETFYSGPPFLPMSDLWMCGMTPPPAIVALIKLSSSSSPRMAS